MGLVAEDLGDISYKEVTYNRSTVEYYQSIYQTVGSHRSALTAVPFNQGSKQDVEALVDYIYATLGMDLHFAAIPENGREN